MSSDLDSILAKIRAFITRSRVRISEYFHDFDKLRSGSVTQEQFRRCLSMCGLVDVVSNDDFAKLYSAYPGGKTNLVNYLTFIGEVTSDTGPAKVSTEVVVQLSASDAAVLDQVLPVFAHQATTAGFILKNFFRDFDKHNTGIVSLAQFRRGIPFKVSEAQFGVLQRAYQDSQGNIRYWQFCSDVAAARKGTADGGTANGGSGGPDVTPLVKLGPPLTDYDVEGLLLELKKQVKQYRIRVEEPFRDYDRLRTGLITPAQFMAGLGKIKLQKLTLSDVHLQLLTRHYSTIDDQGVTKVGYTRFVDDMDSVFTEKNLEKSPTKSVRPDAGEFSTRAEVNPMRPEEQLQLNAILERIRTQVRTRRLFLKPYFQDFDRAVTGVYQTQACTRERFERVLALNGVPLTAAEYALLEKRYEVRKAGNSTERVNYVLFCGEVDPPVEPPAIAVSAPQSVLATSVTKKAAAAAREVRSVRQIVEDIQLHCYDKRLRLSEFLRDFDLLRTGCILLDKFSSGLSIAGIALDDSSKAVLLDAYRSPKVPNGIRWMEFADEVDQIFTTKGLECDPAKEHQSAQALLQKRAEEHMPKGADNEEVVYVLNKIAENVRNRGVLLPPFFKDFDRHNTGRISATQFQQVLSRHGFPVNAAQVAKLTLAYSDPRDPNVVNVRLFIKAVDSTEDTSKIKELQQKRDAADTAQLSLTRNSLAASAPKPPVDIDLVIVRVRSHVTRERVRVRDFFADADRMRKGVVPLVKFGPCVDLIGAKLFADELAGVVERYRRDTPNQEPVADYLAFCDDVDPAGGIMGLEKSPTKSAPKVEPRARFANALESNTLSEDQRSVLENTMVKVRAVVRARRMMLQPFFVDFDKLRKERVTAAQFVAATDKMKLQLSDTEIKNLLLCMRDERGDIDYAQFIKLVEN